MKTWLCTLCCELSVVISIIQVCSRLDILTQLWYICFKLDYLRKFALCDSQQVESLMFVVLVFLSCPVFSHANPYVPEISTSFRVYVHVISLNLDWNYT